MLLLFNRHASRHLRLSELLNVIACSFFLVMTLTTTCVTLFDLLPHLYSNHTTHLFLHRCMVVFIFTNVMGNFLLCVLTDTSTRGCTPGRNQSRGSNTWDPGNNTCDVCQLPRPPRGFHCKLCQRCILKRDHHCFFMTVCIGYRNQKHFIMFCFYMSLGCCYSVVVHAKYLHSVFDTSFYGPQTFITLLADLIMDFHHGTIPSKWYLFLLVVLYSSLIMSAMSSGFFFWQMAISISGQTTHEAWRGIGSYSLNSVRGNLGDVFGRYWPLVVLLPLPLPQTGSGYYGDVPRGQRKKKRR